MLDFNNSLVVVSLFVVLIARESRVKFLVEVTLCKRVKEPWHQKMYVAPFAKNRARSHPNEPYQRSWHYWLKLLLSKAKAGLRPSATKKLKSLQKNLKTRTRRRNLVRHKSFQRISWRLWREKRNWRYYARGTARNHQKICSCCAKEKWWRIRTLVPQSVYPSIDLMFVSRRSQ